MPKERISPNFLFFKIRIGFNTAFFIFLIFLFAVPLIFGANLVLKAVHSEEKRISDAFFRSMEKQLGDAVQSLIEKCQRANKELFGLVKDQELYQADLTRFRSVAAKFFSFQEVRSVFLLASDGTQILGSGSMGIESFQALLKNPNKRPVLTCLEGCGVQINPEKPNSPYLFVAIDLPAISISSSREMKEEFEAGNDIILLLIKKDGKKEWHTKELAGATESIPISSFLTLPPGFNPQDSLARIFMVSSATRELGCLIRPISDSVSYLMIRDTGVTKREFRNFLISTCYQVLFSFGFVVFLGVLFSNLIGFPVRQLVNVCRQIEAGDYDITIPETPFEELSLLGSTLSQMAARVSSRIEVANQEILERHRRLSAVFECIKARIYLLDKTVEVICLANSIACRRMNVKVIPPEGIPLDGRRRSLLKELGENACEFYTEFYDEFDGRFYGINAFPLTDHLGTSLGFVVVERDITIEKEMVRMKNEFVSNVSHELRTPLTSIQAYTEMLVDGEISEPSQIKEYLGIILFEAERLTRLVNDVLDLSRIESGKQRLKPASIIPCEIAEHATYLMERWAKKKKQKFSVELDRAISPLTADKDLLEQALLNLLSNAIKYTPDEGRISLKCRQERDEILFVVCDSGIGMNKSELSQLFSKFFRADNDLVRQAGGTGLGLVLVQEIALLHGGRVQVESNPGQGSIFTLRIPMKNPLLDLSCQE